MMARWIRNDRRYRLVSLVAASGLLFQVFHFGEHGAQLVYWFAHPTAPPWLTPWAEASRDMLSANPVLGAELLHLIGNSWFMLALVALAALARSRSVAGDWLDPLARAHWIQAFHVVEHMALTATWFLFREPIGFSTVFGLLEGQALSSFRVVWHFSINLAATWYAVRAFAPMYRTGLLIPDVAAVRPSVTEVAPVVVVGESAPHPIEA